MAEVMYTGPYQVRKVCLENEDGEYELDLIQGKPVTISEADVEALVGYAGVVQVNSDQLEFDLEDESDDDPETTEV